MSNRWLHERKDEHYYNKAKEEGYRSRASYKLKQIQNKFGIFDDANNVLDLGAAPGGWLQVASENVDAYEGRVLGVDLKPIKPLYAENVATIVGDVRDLEVQEEILNAFEGKADVILSDMAPDVIGECKGYGLQMVSELLGAALTGSRLGPQGISIPPSPNGIFMMAVNPEAFIGLDEFVKTTDGLLEQVKNWPALGGERVMVPGEPEKETKEQRMKEGIELPETTWTEINALCEEIGVDIGAILK